MLSPRCRLTHAPFHTTRTPDKNTDAMLFDGHNPHAMSVGRNFILRTCDLKGRACAPFKFVFLKSQDDDIMTMPLVEITR
jgi:hypothetical protein